MEILWQKMGVSVRSQGYGDAKPDGLGVADMTAPELGMMKPKTKPTKKTLFIQQNHSKS